MLASHFDSILRLSLVVALNIVEVEVEVEVDVGLVGIQEVRVETQQMDVDV
jgi:hypothetical protein